MRLVAFTPPRQSVTMLGALLVLAPATSYAQGIQEIDAVLQLGGAWSVPLPLTVIVDGARTVYTAHYSTRPFQDAPYYSYRLASASEGHALELEMLHHKVYPENPRAPVESFQVSHGYNQAMVNVAQSGDGWG